MYGRNDTNSDSNLNDNILNNFNNNNNNINANDFRLTHNYYDNNSTDNDSNKTIDIECEDLNTATELIKRLESELDDSRASFRRLLTDSSQTITNLAKKLDACLVNAKSYYNGKLMCNLNEEIETITETGDDDDDEENKNVMAKHEVYGTPFSNGYQQSVTELHKKLKHSIVKSSLSSRRNLLQLNNVANQHQLQLLPYFEMKSQFNAMLNEQISKIREYEKSATKAKQSYANALQRLEDNFSYIEN